MSSARLGRLCSLRLEYNRTKRLALFIFEAGDAFRIVVLVIVSWVSAVINSVAFRC